jgi:error-prone DNA polymerase
MPETPNPKPTRLLDPPTEVATGEPDYAELDVTTNFSFLRGASHPDELVFTAAMLGYRAMAVTDVNTLAGVVRAHAAAKQVKGFHLVIGSRLQLTDAPDLLVWATDRAAYGRLCRLLTLGKRRTEKGECSLVLQDFLDHSEGMLAALVLGEEGTKARRHAGTKVPPGALTIPGEPSCLRASVPSCLPLLRDALGDRISLAACCPYGSDDVGWLNDLHELSRATRVPLVATNHVHYHDPARRALQDVLTCVRHGCTIGEAGFKLFPNGERYLKSPRQMHRLFADYPQAIRRGLEIAERCRFSLDELKYEYPDEVVTPGVAPGDYLARLTWDGAAERYPQGVPEKVRRQVNEELALIGQLRIEHYFLTVHDIVRFARSRGILCQGRGSAANSAVCYCLGVTAVDPAVHDLLFARFVSSARNEPPDIDVDFEHERREEVIQYVYQKYGRDRAGMTATVISYRGRSAVRDVGKAMGLSLDMVDSMAGKLDWWDRGVLSDVQLKEVGLDPADRTVRLVCGLAAELLGFPRHLSQHTGGMVMTRGPLCEMIPIENASMPDRTVIEWDKDDIDELGILKVDVLALGMLTALSKALGFINTGATLVSPSSNATERARQASPLQLHTIPDEEPETYDMICDGDTIGVFQIESRAQMAMLPRLRPRKFYDLVIEVAIVRPGPIQGDMVHPYLRRRDGIEPVEYPSEALRGVLENTLGVPLFQEQAMKVVMVAADFSAAEADRLRRAMAAWKKNGALEQFHGKIVTGMLRNGYTREFAEKTFNQIKGFGEYGFPESHAASFARLVYASAWIKRHHPAAFCAALLNSQPMGFYAPAQIVRDARDHGVEVRGVDVNCSEWDCSLEERHEGTKARRHEGGGGKATWGLDGPAVRLGFRQIKGVRVEHAQQLVESRNKRGAFESIPELQRRTGIPVSSLRTLAEADSFGSMGLTRRQALWQVLRLKDEEFPLFDTPPAAPSCLRAFVPSCLPSPDEPPVTLPPMPLGQEVLTDYSTSGLSLKRHPVSLLREELNQKNIITAAELADEDRSPHGRWVKVAGLVLIRQRPGTASGVVFVTMEDETGVANLILWPQTYDQYRLAARHAGLLQCDGYVQRQGKVVHVLARRLFDLSDMLKGYEMRSRDFH